MLFLFRPRPMFQVGALVESIPAKDIERRYLLIESRHWKAPPGSDKKQWVYGGEVLGVRGGVIEFRAPARSVPENSLEYICGPAD